MPPARRPRTPTDRSVIGVGGIARYDVGRGRRTGAPEVILAEGKTVEHLLAVLRELHRRRRGALISRPTPPQRRALLREAGRGLPVLLLAGGRLARLEGPVSDGVAQGDVAVLTAGTADIPVALEAVGVLEAIGIRVTRRFDVGVAGIHRLARALAATERVHPSVYLVFAGREGALPTVVAGLVRAPVIGVPTSVGYGRGGRGEAALNAMLQSCAPVATMNIDAAVPAALFAAQLLAATARRAARPRRRRGSAF
jgi:NCAIR mutase (PurE)-related protein